MGIECGECERDLRGGHARDCSKWTLLVCPECDWLVQDGDGYMVCPSHGEVTPVVMVRALPAAPVVVKPLEWEYHPKGTIAAPPTGQAYIIQTRRVGRPVCVIKGFVHSRDFETLTAAKAAAQADYEARILAALKGGA
jgi:hypothetical protein